MLEYYCDSSGWKCQWIMLIKNTLLGILSQRAVLKRQSIEPHLARRSINKIVYVGVIDTGN